MEISKENKEVEIKEQFESEILQQHNHLYSRAAFNWFKLAIYRAIRHYEDKGVKAERLYLTREDEDFLSINATADSVGESLIGEIVEEGIRKALPTILGLKVFWGANKTEVLPGENFET